MIDVFIFVHSLPHAIVVLRNLSNKEKVFILLFSISPLSLVTVPFYLSRISYKNKVR